MKNRSLIIILLFIITMFSFMIDAKASDYASCYYIHDAMEKDFPIYKSKGLDIPNNKLIITIQYNSEKDNYKTPKIFAKLVDSNVTLSESSDFINAINSDSGFRIPSTARYPDFTFNSLPTINIRQIQNNNQEMMCPNVYLYCDDTKNPADGTVSHSYTISLISESDGFSESFDRSKTLLPLSISKYSSGNSTNTNTSAFSCSYNIKNYKSTIFSFSGVIGFSVDNDGNVFDFISTDSIDNLNLKYEGSKLTECPTYIKLDYKMLSGYTSVTVGTESSYDGVYNGDISSGEDNQDLDVKIIATYRKYGDSNKKITIEKSAGNYNVNLNADSSSGPINISNLNDYISSITDDKAGNFPKYIIKNGDVYSLIENLKNEDDTRVQADEFYIMGSGVNGTGLSDEEVMSTCKELFGETFLVFLDQYVFKIIWIGVPILLILLTTFDFARVVFVNDKEGIANAFGRLRKRAIVSILIFLTPYIIILIANIVDPTQTTIQSCAKTIREMGNTSFVINNLTKLK